MTSQNKTKEAETKLKELLGQELLLIPFHNNGDFSSIVKSMIDGVEQTKRQIKKDAKKDGEKFTPTKLSKETLSTVIINWAITALAAFAMELEVKETKRQSFKTLNNFKEAAEKRIRFLESEIQSLKKGAE